MSQTVLPDADLAHVAPGPAAEPALVVVTVGPDTLDHARRERLLSDALTRRGVGLVAATLEGAAGALGADVKSSFVLDVWRHGEVPVLWLDVDTDVDAIPDLAPSPGVDFAAHDRTGRQGGAATVPDLAPDYLWFGTSAAAGALLTAWVDRCAADPATPDVVHLAAAWSEATEQHALRTAWVPAGHAGSAPTVGGAALARGRSLFDRRRNPYYVAIGDYRESSAGVWAVHALCHALNVAGHEAYIVGAGVSNPDWDTPILTQHQSDAHAAAGLEPIVVYPEVVSGNPLGATTVVRYLLNVPGRFTGEPMQESRDDLIFYYSPQFVGDRDPATADYLMAPTIDPTVFRPDPSVARDKVLVYSHRFPAERIDLSLFPPGAELLTMTEPLTLPELARVFQSAAVLYSYELSGTCTMAMACGCPVVYRREGGMTELPTTFLLGDNGAAMADEPGGLERATRTVAEVPRIIAGMERAYWDQLAVFVAKTQEAADRRRRR